MSADYGVPEAHAQNLENRQYAPFGKKPIRVYSLISEVPQILEIYRSNNGRYAWRLVIAGKPTQLHEIPNAAGIKKKNIDLVVAALLNDAESSKTLFNMAWEGDTVH